MRVLLTTDTIGGVWTFTTELTAGLLRRGHAVALVSLGRAPSRSQTEWTCEIGRRYQSAFRYEMSEAPLEWMSKNGAAYSDAESLMLRLVVEFEAEIVHGSQFCFGALPVAVPKIITAHSDVLSWAQACEPGGLEQSAWLQRYEALVSAGIVGADVIVAPTHWSREALARHFPASAGARVILNGRTLEAASKVEVRRLQAVSVGRVWDSAKGLTVLDELDACMPVLIIGEACFEGGQMPKLGNVEFLGKLDEDEVLEVLRRSSVYLTTSIYEPFGLAPLEAALCGCGVVARDIPSLREVWGDAAVYFRNGKELSQIMLCLRDSEPELMALRDRCKHRAQELSADRMVEGYIAQYEQLLALSSVREEVVAYAS